MKTKLVINITNDESHIAAFYFDATLNSYQFLNMVNFNLKGLINNATFVDQMSIETIIKTNYDQIIKNCNGINFQEIDLILPFQIPILKVENYLDNQKTDITKEIDNSQFFRISEHKITLENRNRYQIIYYYINKVLFEKYLNIFKNLKIAIKSVYTSGLLIGYAFEPNSKINLVIKISQKNTIYNFYKGNKIFVSKKIALGLDLIFEKIKLACEQNYNLETRFEINNLIDLLNTKNIFKKIEDKTLMVFYGYSPLKALKMHLDDLRNNISNTIFKIFYGNITKFMKELEIQELNNIVLYKNEFLYEMFEKILETKTNFNWNLINNLISQNDNLDPLISCYLNHQNFKIKK